MPPEGYKAFGGGGETTLHPAVIAVVVVTVLVMWAVPRKHMMSPFLLLAVLVPVQQQIILGGLHLVIVRILLACAWLRVLPNVLRERRICGNRVQALDGVLIASVLTLAVAYTLQWQDSGALINRLGLLYTAFGIYFLFRNLIRSTEDVDRAVGTFAVVCCIIAALMVAEQITGENPMSALGMRAEAEIRNGRIRSQGPFQHPIIAGTCGATMLPVFLGMLWTRRKGRAAAVAGVIASTIMTVASASSTPVAAYLAGILGLFMWPVRRYMRFIRWSLVVMLVLLHIVMKAPVWALIGRISLASGSTSWHRFALVDHFIRHFGDWWLIGTRNNAQWGLDMWDTVNWYVASGISGGLIGFVLFVAVIVCGYRSVGRALRRPTDEGASQWAWALGASIFANTIAFLGIVYFDQSIVFWYGLLAMTAVAPTIAGTASAPRTHSCHSFDGSATEPLAATSDVLLHGRSELASRTW